MDLILSNTEPPLFTLQEGSLWFGLVNANAEILAQTFGVEYENIPTGSLVWLRIISGNMKRLLEKLHPDEELDQRIKALDYWLLSHDYLSSSLYNRVLERLDQLAKERKS